MPNFHIPAMIQEHLIGRASKLADRPVMLALGAFPLDVDQIQHSLLPQEQLDTMQRLVDEGIQTISRHSEIRLALLRDNNLPGIRRSVVVYLNLPKSIFVGRSTLWSISTTKFEEDEKHYIIPSFDNLDGSAREELCVWVDRCVRQVRLREIVNFAVTQILRNHAPTTSHLHALWPELGALIDPDQVHSHERAQYRKWVERMRNPARRNLGVYKPKLETRERFGKMIQAANVHLAAGMVLNDYQYKRGQIRAQIEHWEHIEGDLRLPS